MVMTKYVDTYFVNNNAKMECSFQDSWILITDMKLQGIKSIVKPLEMAIASNKPLLIIANDIEGEALAGLIVNKARGTCKVAAIKAPEYGERQAEMLEDIAILTGGTFISGKKGMTLDKMSSDMFGTATKISIDNKTTTIVGGGGTIEDIEKRADDIKNQLDNASTNFEIEYRAYCIGSPGPVIGKILPSLDMNKLPSCTESYSMIPLVVKNLKNLF